MTHRHKEISKPKLLLGEGKDEVEFFEALLQHLKIDDVQPMEYGGKPNFRAVLEAILQMPNFYTVTSIGITRDADFSKNPKDQAVDSAFKSICGTLRYSKIDLPTPKRPMQMAHQTGKPSTKIFIMPDCENEGMLEDLCLTSLEDRVEITCVDEYIKCLEMCRDSPIPNHKLPKTRFKTWIASQDKPDLSLGVATKKKYIDFNHSTFDKLKQFLESL